MSGDRYMGETDGSLKVTLKEYRRAVKQHDNRNVITAHTNNIGNSLRQRTELDETELKKH